jgi:UDP-N-acetylmuramoyl-tripeptide--D-alanyl-D-alanine ligase
MLELGDISFEEHYKIGEYAATSGVDILIAAGSFSEDIKSGGLSSGMNCNSIYAFASADEVIASLEEIIRPGDVVLIKGSRRMKMEFIVDYLRERG